MQHTIKLKHIVPVQNFLGECVIWDHRNQHIYWTDIEKRTLFCRNFAGELMKYTCPDKLCSFGLCTDTQWLICAFASGFALFKPTTGQITWLNSLFHDQTGLRLNDGRVDRQGRFWAGSLFEGQADNRARGALYRLELDGSITEHMQQIEIANSLCWAPNAETIYFADSPSRVIQKAAFDPQTGQAKDWQPFIHTEEGAYPDGACIDSEGCLWSAQWASSTVKRYSPSGDLLLSLELPCQQPTCVCFAGAELNYLCVTSATQGLTAHQTQQHDGHLFIYETPFTGLPEEICVMPILLD